MYFKIAGLFVVFAIILVFTMEIPKLPKSIEKIGQKLIGNDEI